MLVKELPMVLHAYLNDGIVFTSVYPAMVVSTVHNGTMRYPIIHLQLFNQGQINVLSSFHQTKIFEEISKLTVNEHDH